MSTMNAKCCYVWDENLIQQCNRLNAVVKRASLVNDLIVAYGLPASLKVVKSSPATYEDLKEFHLDLYLNHLKQFTNIDDEYIATADDEEFGIGFDCPPIPNMFELMTIIAGGSITAAKCLLLGLGSVAINWCGGWHHAQRAHAGGFCYVNDIVLAIEKLKQKFPKILYIDLDAHHGDGVQDAFSLSKSVFTLSFHKYEPGFYPGTGSIDDIGTLAGKGYSCNFPLHAFYSDDTLIYAFKHVFGEVNSRFSPDAIVVQCGADALARDKIGQGALTERGYCTCVQMVLDKKKPTMLLGGGGYNNPNVARLWTSITALAAGVTLDEDIPEHINWPQYGPDYKLHVEPTLAKDCNKKTYLDDCISTISDNINKYLIINPREGPELKRKKTEMNIRSIQYSANCYKLHEDNVVGKTDIITEKLMQSVLNNKANKIYSKETKEMHSDVETKSTISSDVYEFVD